MITFIDVFTSEWLTKAGDGIMGAIMSGIRTLLYGATSIIYELLVNVYKLFERLCGTRILGNELISEMANRIGLVLGLIMFFYIVFQLIQILIDPEKMMDKDKGALQIVKKVILVVVALALSNVVFEAAFGLQKLIIESDVIPRLLIPYNIETENGSELENFGNILSVELLGAFYQMDENIADEKIREQNGITIRDVNDYNSSAECNLYVEALYDQIYKYNKYDLGYVCLNRSVNITRTTNTGKVQDDQVYIVNFNWIIAPLVGGFALYMILMYCFKVGVRMIQLAFLEIISPMAIVSILSPKKDNMFTKWWKVYSATYIDVFIRLAIIYLVIFLCCAIFSADSLGGKIKFWESFEGLNGTEQTFLTVVIVLALLTFAKKAPELLKELLPAGASKLGFGLSVKDVVGLEKGTKIAGGILGGAAAGTVVGLLGRKGIGSKVTGALGGFVSGALKGFKGEGFAKTTANAIKNQQATNRRLNEWKAAGGGPLPFGRWAAGIQQYFGQETAADIDEREISMLEEYEKIQKSIEDTAEHDKTVYDVKGKKEAYELAVSSGPADGEDPATYTSRVASLKSDYKNARKDFINDAMRGRLANNPTADLIRSYQAQLNRMVSSNASVFSGISQVTNYDIMDTNSMETTNRAAQRKTTKQYARNKANAKSGGKGK